MINGCYMAASCSFVEYQWQSFGWHAEGAYKERDREKLKHGILKT